MGEHTKRGSARIDYNGTVKIRLLAEDKEVSASIKDLSLTWLRVVISGRIVTKGAPVELVMCIDARQGQGHLGPAAKAGPGRDYDI
jgi:hypothetical protein